MATDEELKRALKAFKKRLKLTRLDDESGSESGRRKKNRHHGNHTPKRSSTWNLGRACDPGQT